MRSDEMRDSQVASDRAPSQHRKTGAAVWYTDVMCSGNLRAVTTRDCRGLLERGSYDQDRKAAIPTAETIP
jgi:hypothetical protein